MRGFEKYALLVGLCMQPNVAAAGGLTDVEDELAVSKRVERILDDELGDNYDRAHKKLKKLVEGYEGEPTPEDVEAISKRMVELAWIEEFGRPIDEFTEVDKKYLEDLERKYRVHIYYLLRRSEELNDRRYMLERISNTLVIEELSDYEEMKREGVVDRPGSEFQISRVGLKPPREDFWETEWQYLSEKTRYPIHDEFIFKRIELWMESTDFETLPKAKLLDLITNAEELLRLRRIRSEEESIPVILFRKCIAGLVSSNSPTLSDDLESILLNSRTKYWKLKALENSGVLAEVRVELIKPVMSEMKKYDEYDRIGIYAWLSILYTIESKPGKKLFVDELIAQGFPTDWMIFDFSDLSGQSASRAGVAAIMLDNQHNFLNSGKVRRALIEDGFITKRDFHEKHPRAELSYKRLEAIARRALTEEARQLFGAASKSDEVPSDLKSEIQLLADNVDGLIRDAFLEEAFMSNGATLLEDDFEPRYRSVTHLLTSIIDWHSATEETNEIVSFLEYFEESNRLDKESMSFYSSYTAYACCLYAIFFLRSMEISCVIFSYMKNLTLKPSC